MATLVKFRIHKDEDGSEDLFAYFPQLFADNERIFRTAYSTIGQHSSCAPEYEKESRQATESEYSDLKKELESIGYTLKVCK